MDQMGERGNMQNCGCCQHIAPLNYFSPFSYSNSHPFHCCQCCPSCPYCLQNRLLLGFCVPTCSSCPLPPPPNGSQPSVNTGEGGGGTDTNTGRGGGTNTNKNTGEGGGGADTNTGRGGGTNTNKNTGGGGGADTNKNTGGGEGTDRNKISDTNEVSEEEEEEEEEEEKPSINDNESRRGGEGRSEVQPRLVIKDPIGTNPPWSAPKLYASGVQSLVPTIAATAVVPSVVVRAMGGGIVQRAQVIQASLFTMGISSLLQVWFGTRLPVLMQKSRSFTIPVAAIALSSAMRYNRASYSKIDDTFDFNSQIFKESIRRIQGATIIGAIFQIIIGFSCLGEIFARYLSPLATVPLVTLTGFGIFTGGFPVLANCNIQLGLPALILLVFSTQYLPHIWKSKKEFLDQYSVTFSAALLWAYAEILNRAGSYNHNASYASQGTELSCDSHSGVVDAASWIKIPLPFPYGGPVFEVGDACLIVAACFVDAIESAGTFIATSRLAGADPIPPSVLSRGIGLQGIGNLVAALLGTGSGSTASVEQAGLVGLTQVGSRRVIQVSATLMLLFSVIGKLGALLASIPLPIEVAIQMVLLPFVASTGLDYLQFCNMNSFRLIFIVGSSIFMGLSVPQYFYEYAAVSGQGPVRTNYTWFSETVRVIFSSPPTVGVIVAFILDRTHSPKDGSVKRDSGWEWKDLWNAIDPVDSTFSIISNFEDLCS